MQLTQEELRKAQLLMLKILKEVHRICEENNIKYFLSDGTLIGAVRHNGFIPWDDDLDIGMLRDEYDKFCAIAPDKLGEEFVFQTTDTDPGYGLQFGKVMLKGTVWVENGAIDTKRENLGIYIDIFPYDKITSNKLQQKGLVLLYKLINGLILYKKNYYFSKSKVNIKNCIKFVLSFFLSVKLLIKIRMLICTHYKKISKINLVTKYGGNFYNNQNFYESYNQIELCKFEDSYFYIPKDFDIILTKLYGNYMKIPPKEKQQNHGIINFDFGSY